MTDTELVPPSGDLAAAADAIARVVTVRDHGSERSDGRWLEGSDPKLRALLEGARLDARRRRLDVLDERAKTVARLELWEVRATGRGRPGIRLRVHALRGYRTDHDALLARLRADLGYATPATALADEMLRALGRDPTLLRAKVSVRLTADQRADAAAVAVLRSLAAVIEANRDGAADDLHPEFLHDLRVSVRRTRAVQRQLKAVFPPAELRRARDEFRWLQQATGELRDLDVQLEELDELRRWMGEPFAADLAPVEAVLGERRALAQGEVAGLLRGRRATRLLESWGGLLEELVELPLTDRPRAADPVAELAGERIGKVYRRMVRDGRRIEPGSPDEALHDLRKRGKELRYLLELFGSSLFPAAAVDPLVKSLKALQDTLGRHQDRHVQIERLPELGPELVDRAGGAAALIAVGVAVRVLREDAVAARAEFAERFDAFAARRMRRAVKHVVEP